VGIKGSRSSELKRDRESSGGFDGRSIVVGPDETDTFGDALALARATAIDYPSRHRCDIDESRQRLRKRAKVFPRNMRSLYSVLSQEAIYSSDHVIPRVLKRKSKIKPQETIKISKTSATVEKELGRGAYGTVVLLEANPSCAKRKVCIKAQSPTDCLAWEYEILESLDRRCRRAGEKSPFPRPFSYLGLEDGALLAMTASSCSGLTILDLVNNYKMSSTTASGLMPEILAIHYASRMLRTIELLHHKGKILVGFNVSPFMPKSKTFLTSLLEQLLAL